MKIIAILWITIGLIQIFMGIDSYIHYSNGGFFLFMIPEETLIKNIILGIISIFIGVGLLKNPKSQIKQVYSIPLWAIIFIILAIIKDSVLVELYGTSYLWTIDYLYFLLSFFTLKAIQKEVDFDRVSWKIFIRNNWLFILISGVLISSLIFIISLLFPYEFFY